MIINKTGKHLVKLEYAKIVKLVFFLMFPFSFNLGFRIVLLHQLLDFFRATHK